MKHINDKGFSLVEMIVATAIFVVIIMITGAAFEAVLKNVGLVNKTEESNIEGVVGLEMFRRDIEQAGFGLPDSFAVPISYTEAGSLPASTYNDAGNNASCNGVPCSVPRAIVGGNDLPIISDPNSYNGVSYAVLQGTDYLALKGTSLGITPAAQKWTYQHYSSTASYVKQWGGGNLNANDQVIVINRTFPTSPGPANQLVNPTSQNYWTTYNSAGLLPSFAPTQPGQFFHVYGVQSAGNSSSLGMPFNRTDYFVAQPSDNSLPSSCAPGTGILYKAIVNHSNGELTYLPIMNCIADMQVVLGWSLGDASGNLVTNDYATGSGLIDTWSNADGSVPSSNLSLPSLNYVQQTILSDPAHIRTKLKLVKVYILAQVGRKDPNYTSPASIQMYEPNTAEASLVRPTTTGNFNLTPGMLNYRWKVYRLVVKPNNLISNQ